MEKLRKYLIIVLAFIWISSDDPETKEEILDCIKDLIEMKSPGVLSPEEGE